MKFSFKITLSVLAAAILLNVSCKKDTAVSATPDKAIAFSRDISKQIALDLYHSLSSGISTVTNNGVRVGNVRGPVVMDNDNPCGQVVKDKTNKTTVSGDTTRTILGNSVFTYLCDGYYNNGWNVDAYSLHDTLTTTEKGAGFKDIYNTTIDYKVKAADGGYSTVNISGFTNTQSYKSKLSGDVITEFHRLATGYKWDDVTAKRTAGKNPSYIDGKVQFSAFIFDKYGKDVTNTQPTGAYSGYMQFLPNDMVKTSFYVQGSGGSKTKDFLVNLITGEVTEL
nr:hypothetical protein [Mucilaginibacter sp. L294]